MGFRGKQIATLTVVAATVALTTSLLNAALLARSRLEQMRDHARLLAQTLYHQASGVIRRSARDDLPRSLSSNAGLRSYADAVIGYSPVTLYLAIVDRDGTALFHSNPRLEGTRLVPAESIADFSERSGFSILWDLLRHDRALLVDLPFGLDGSEPFGSARIAVSTLLLRTPLVRAVAFNALLAAGVVLVVFFSSFVVANRLLAPIEMLRRELARIPTARGEPPLDLRSEEDVGRLALFFASVGERLKEEPQEDTHREWLAAMLDGMTDAVIAVDCDRHVLSLNAVARRFLALPQGVPVSVPLDDLLEPDHPVVAIGREACTTGCDVERKRCTLRREGKDVPHELSARILRQGKTIAGVMITARDLDKLSRVASRLSYSQKLASLGQLTSGVAHEIKNPLNAMVMQSALLRKKLPSEEHELSRHLDILDDEIHRLDRVIDGFVTFSRPERVRFESVDLADVVRTALEKVCGNAAQTGIEIEMELATDLPAVPGDRVLLEQVFSNLLCNAREAMPQGGSLRIEMRREDDGICTSVIDTGTGIPQESIPEIFDLYYTTKERGSGIGLSVVYRIVQLHGGEVAVRSEPGQGTSMTVVLPESLA